MKSDTPVEVFMRPAPLVLATELDQWLLSIKGKIGMRILQNLDTDTDQLDRYIEFAEIKEIPGAFVACSFYQKDINDALTRAGIFMGAGKGMKAKTLVSHNDFTLINYKKLVAGHNLPGPTVREFFKEISKSDINEIQANPAEAAVAAVFLKSQRLEDVGENFYLIGFSIQTMKDQKGVISHEVFHAYSFLDPKFREVVSNFWKNVVSVEDKEAITKEIGIAYNVDDESLVIDEFQAYLIQNKAELDRMKKYVPKYRSQLLSELSQSGVELISI